MTSIYTEPYSYLFVNKNIFTTTVFFESFKSAINYRLLYFVSEIKFLIVYMPHPWTIVSKMSTKSDVSKIKMVTFYENV